MSRPIPSSHASSNVSAAAFVLAPERSRLLAAWRVGVHVLAAVAILASGMLWPLKLAACAACLIAVLRRAPPPLRLERRADGLWSAPELDPAPLALSEGTAVGPFWVLLRLRGQGRPVSVLLLEDQLDADVWRRLVAELRHTPEGGTV